MRTIPYLTTLKRSLCYLGPAFLLPIILISVIDFKRDLDRIDQWLLSMAKSVPLLLEQDFHDRAVTENSIDFEEELVYRERFNRYREYNGITWVYTLIEKEGRLFMTAPSVTKEEALQQERWYFFEYPNAPEAFFRALRMEQIQYTSYRDQWGRFRTVILPRKSPAGNPYAVCVDLAMPSYASLLLKRTGFKSLVLLASFLFIILYISFLSSANIAGNKPSRHVLMSRKDLQKIIDLQTDHLHQLTEKERANNLQLTNALYAGRMGLYAFNTSTGRLDHVFNNMLPETLGYQHGQYQLHLRWLITHIVDPEIIPQLELLWEEIISGRKTQSSMDLRLRDKGGRWLWYRIHLTLQKGATREEDNLLVLAQGIQDVKMRERVLLQQVQTDDLTGLYNRSYWEEYIKAIRSRNRRSDLPLVVCYIDINGLKTVNDNLGHNAGDKLLTDFAAIVAKTIRGADIAVRLGGDEFLLVCPQTYEIEFDDLWQRIIANTEKFNNGMDRDYALSFSHGVCVLHSLTDKDLVNTLLEEADRKMYEEKREMKEKGLVVLRS